jgi:hypothetical protein
MTVSWKQLSFIPAQDALDELRGSWQWLVDATMLPFMCATCGDVFFVASDGGVHWLDTGRGSFERIADSRDEFLERMRADGGREWLMADVVDELLAAGATIGEGQCFGYRTLPILGGDYTPDNMVPMSAAAWFGFSGYLHEQIKDLPDGAQVELSVTE